MKTFAKYFLQGSLVVAPLAVTIYVIYRVVTAIDHLLPVGIPMLGFVLTILLIAFVGFLTSNVIGRSLVELTERMLQKLPLVKLVYNSIKDLVGAFVGDKKSFDKPVVVTLPGGGAKMLGFVTCESIRLRGLEDLVAVYLPQSYNFAGNLIVVARDRIAPLEADSSDLMSFVVSGGVSKSTRVSRPDGVR